MQKKIILPLWLETYLAWTFLFLCSFLNNYPWTFGKKSFFNKLRESETKTKNLGVAGWKVGQKWHRDNCSHPKKVQQKYRDIACKAKNFPPYLRQAAKIYVATSLSVVRQETIEISEQRTSVWFFCTRGRLMSERLWQTALADHCIKKPLKIFASNIGDWFDVKTASICTTELWDALKSFILTSLKIKVAPFPVIMSLDNLTDSFTHQGFFLQMASIHHYFARKQVGDTKNRGETRDAHFL